MGRAQSKIDRVRTALDHEQPDRVPVGEFFWTNFIRRCKKELDVGPDFDPYRYWDLDVVVINPNMDPHITGIEVLEDRAERKVVRTGFGATIERVRTLPMPHFADFETKTYAQMEALEFDDPHDRRRYFERIDDQINSVGDELNLGLPAFVERLEAYADDFCLFGGVCEPHEMIWRIMGSENVLLKLAEAPDRMAGFIERLGNFAVGLVEGQIEAAAGRLNGMFVWGDIAYVNGMMFSPHYWREVYQPQLRKICDAIHAAGLKAIYHSDGKLDLVLDDLIDAGIDGLNPLECKAGMDGPTLKPIYGDRLSLVGNLDVQVLETGDLGRIRAEVQRKLGHARQGGWILQSDHSISSNVAPAVYDAVIQQVRAADN